MGIITSNRDGFVFLECSFRACYACGVGVVCYLVRDARLSSEEDLWMLMDRVVTVVWDFDGLPHVVSQSRLSCSNKQKQTGEEDICP